ASAAVHWARMSIRSARTSASPYVRPAAMSSSDCANDSRSPSTEGTVTLVEKWSGTVGFGAAAMKQRLVVHLSGNEEPKDTPGGNLMDQCSVARHPMSF